jgi:hypothetical protein
MTFNDSSSPEDKITLFRTLFRGRQDVYARRFESRKNGRAPDAVEEDIVSFGTAGKIAGRVVHDVVCTQGADELHVPRAAHTGDLGASRFGDLLGEGAHPPAAPLMRTFCPG